jgi:hypothetical protein
MQTTIAARPVARPFVAVNRPARRSVQVVRAEDDKKPFGLKPELPFEPKKVSSTHHRLRLRRKALAPRLAMCDGQVAQPDPAAEGAKSWSVLLCRARA